MRSAPQVLALVVAAVRPLAVAASVPNWFDQSWYFQWTAPNQPVPVPTTGKLSLSSKIHKHSCEWSAAQCETLDISWSRQTATGPDGVAPYFLQIYTSAYIFPFVIPAGSNPQTSLTIPFAPGTQYQICMFDSSGNTGGCQAVYTVYPNTTNSNPSCANFTMPAKAMSVTSESSLGTLSQYGWVDSCSDIKVTPKEGTAPFKLTIAPALHPPVNITSNDMSPINWTVALSWGQPFFISLVDSTGLSWSNGPIHAGNGKTACLNTDSPPHTATTASLGVTVGAAVAGVAVGALVSLLAAYLISKRRKGKHHHGEPTPFYSDSSSEVDHYRSVAQQSPALVPMDGRPFSYPTPGLAKQRSRPLDSSGAAPIPHEYEIEPFQRDGQPRLSTRNSTSGLSETSRPPAQSWPEGTESHSHATNVTSPTRTGQQEGNSQVYVIHHDSGGAPVSVITSRGTEVVELPPGYSAEYLSAGGSSGGQGSASSSVQRRREKTPAGSGADPGRTP